jgi:SAM-dependent methyltransferase
MTVKKHGINIGCGRVILPAPRPKHHVLIPEHVYSDQYTWDNVDSVAQPGVNKVIDVFDYQWREAGKASIPDSTYDLALATHLVEHIPHVVVENGQFKQAHGGWWAWWNELGRVLKPGGVAHILTPYGFSRGGFIDPTHTRYLIPETFGYLSPDENAPFEYPIRYRWEQVDGVRVAFSQHTVREAAHAVADLGTFGQVFAATHINAVDEFSISLRVIK